MSSLSIHLTDLCNSRCSFCVVGSPLFVKDTIKFEDVEAFLIQNSDRGYSSVNLHGGEATIHPKFFDILRLIRSLGYKSVQLQTNAIRLADKGFASTVAELGVQNFVISLHGSRPFTHDSQTGTIGGFAKTITGIENVKSLGRHVRTNTVVTKQNLLDLPDIVGLACELEVDHINISNLHPVGSATFGFERIVANVRDISNGIPEAIERALGYERTITLEGFPYCTVKGYEHLHLNEEDRNILMLMRGRTIKNYDAFMNDTCRVLGDTCQPCSVKSKCGGVYPEYIQRKGWDEFEAI